MNCSRPRLIGIGNCLFDAGAIRCVSWRSTCRRVDSVVSDRKPPTSMRATGPDQIKFPAVLSLGKEQLDLSWHGLMQHLCSRALTAEADAQLQTDASWAAIRRCLRRQGICYPRMLVVHPCRPPELWLVPRSLPWNPSWLGPLLRVFPPLDSGDKVQEVPFHQALLHEVMWGGHLIAQRVRFLSSRSSPRGGTAWFV